MRAALLLVLVTLLAPAALAQDFAPAGPPASHDALSLLEDALPGEPAAAAATTLTRWWGIPSLVTRAAAVQVPAASAMLAVGGAQSGDEAIGWSTLGCAAGAATDTWGGALRAALRRDRTLDASATGAWGAGRGFEAGGGAWLRPTRSTEVWASAPQLWVRGVPPPLARSLRFGARARADDLTAWVGLAGPRRGAEAGERTAGAALEVGSASLWLELRDTPWRAAGGVTAHMGSLTAACLVETHPVLDETVRLSLGWSAR